MCEQYPAGASSMSPASSKKFRRPGFDFSPGVRIEARDHNNMWYAAKIVEVDWEEKEILIHFENWSSRYDEWISMDSARLRPTAQVSRRNEVQKPGRKEFKVGEKVMAAWSDSKKYEATVKAVISDDCYEVIFYDGFNKKVKASRITKIKQNSDTEALPGTPNRKLPKQPLQPSPQQLPPLPPVSKRLFPPPEDIGTKEERRQRKRKFGSVAELFYHKKKRLDGEHFHHRVIVTSADEDNASEQTPPPPTPPPLNNVKAAELNEVEVAGRKRGRLRRGEDPSLPRKRKKKAWREEEEEKEAEWGKGGSKVNSVAEEVKEERVPMSNGKEKVDKAPGRRERAKKLPVVREVVKKVNGEREDNELVGQGEGLEDEVDFLPSRSGKRSTIVVRNKDLPPGWKKKAIQRQYGVSAGKWDVYLMSPDGRKFRSRKEIRAYVEENGLKVDLKQFDFTLGEKLLSFAKSKGDPVVRRKVKVSREVNKTPEGKKWEFEEPAPKEECKKNVPTIEPEKLPIVPPVIQMDDHGSFRCPKEGCSKQFRKENLLQMHVKHYHPEYCKFIGSAPNVADLAYARTIGESLEETSSRHKTIVDKVNRTDPKKHNSQWKHSPSPDRKKPHKVPNNISELNEALSEFKSEFADMKVKVDLDMTTDIKLKTGENGDVMSASKMVGVEGESKCLVEGELKQEEAGSEGPKGVLKPILDWDKLVNSMELPPKKEAVESKKKGKTVMFTEEVLRREKEAKRRRSESHRFGFTRRRKSGNSSGEGRRKSLSDAVDDCHLKEDEEGSKQSKKSQTAGILDRRYLRVQLEKLEITTDSQGRVCYLDPLDKLKSHPIPDGHLRMEEGKGKGKGKLSHKKNSRAVDVPRKEVINCVCGITEEDGLMIQCDQCQCWQHGFCCNIEEESQVPEKYICVLCQYPVFERLSMHYVHDQDWMKQGKLPYFAAIPNSAKPAPEAEARIKKSFDVMTDLLQAKQFLNSLSVKLHIARQPDHHKLYLWDKSWVTTPQDPLCREKPSTVTSSEEDANLGKLAASLSPVEVQRLLESQVLAEVSSSTLGEVVSVEKDKERVQRLETYSDHSYATQITKPLDVMSDTGSQSDSGISLSDIVPTIPSLLDAQMLCNKLRTMPFNGLPPILGTQDVNTSGSSSQERNTSCGPNQEINAVCGPIQETSVMCAPSQETSAVCDPSKETSAVCDPSKETSAVCGPSKETSAICGPSQENSSVSNSSQGINIVNGSNQEEKTVCISNQENIAVDSCNQQTSAVDSSIQETSTLSSRQEMNAAGSSIQEANAAESVSSALEAEVEDVFPFGDLPSQGSQVELSSIPSLDLSLSQSEFEQLASSVEENLIGTTETVAPRVPEPEARIDPEVCRENLLEHISHSQAQLASRFDDFEAQLSELESQQPRRDKDNGVDEPRMKLTLQMLLRDLELVHQVSEYE